MSASEEKNLRMKSTLENLRSASSWTTRLNQSAKPKVATARFEVLSKNRGKSSSSARSLSNKRGSGFREKQETSVFCIKVHWVTAVWSARPCLTKLKRSQTDFLPCDGRIRLAELSSSRPPPSEKNVWLILISRASTILVKCDSLKLRSGKFLTAKATN